MPLRLLATLLHPAVLAGAVCPRVIRADARRFICVGARRPPGQAARRQQRPGRHERWSTRSVLHEFTGATASGAAAGRDRQRSGGGGAAATAAAQETGARGSTTSTSSTSAPLARIERCGCRVTADAHAHARGVRLVSSVLSRYSCRERARRRAPGA